MQLASSGAGQIHQEISLLHSSWSPIYLPAQGFTVLTQQKKKKGEEEKQEVGGQGKVPECSISESFGTEDRLQRMSNKHSFNTVCGLALHRHSLIQPSNDVMGRYCYLYITDKPKHRISATDQNQLRISL